MFSDESEPLIGGYDPKFAQTSPAAPAASERESFTSKHGVKFGLVVVLTVIVGFVVLVTQNSGSNAKNSSSVAAATETPTTSTVTTSTAEPASPPSQPGLADCTVMYGDMQDASSPFSFISQVKTSNGRLVTGVVDTSHVLSASSPTSTLRLNFKDSDGNPYGIGSVTGSVRVNADGSTIMSVTLNDSKFYISKMGGVTSGSQLVPNFLDPQQDIGLVAFQGNSNSPTSVTVGTVNPSIVFNAEGSPLACSSRSSPLPSCAGPWYSYHFVEICPKNSFATKAPKSASPPTPLATPAPSSATPAIELVFTSTDTPTSIVTAFENARDIWNDIIINTHESLTLPAATTNAGSLGCSDTSKFPFGVRKINGLIIFATIGPIDGKGKILGQAGPCSFSYEGATSSTFGKMLPRIGEMKFDVVDLQAMVDDGTLERVIMHEIGHVLGIGSMWGNVREGSAGDANNDPRYVGVNGVAGYKRLGGLRSSIPVANTGGGGTENSHWREATFEDELMSGYASGHMPVSIMTVKSLQDLGYTVVESKAEPYSIPLVHKNAFKTEASSTFGNDVLTFKHGKVMTFSPNALKP
jgi:hypothetical protein